MPLYNPYRDTAVKTASNILQKGADKLASMDKSSKTTGARLEELVAKVVNGDPNVEFTVNYVQTKFQIPGNLMVIPKFNDATLMIEKYALIWTGTKAPVIIIDDAESVCDITDELAALIQTRDPDVIDQFLARFQ